MKLISEKKALEKLQTLKRGFAERIKSDFENRAKNCSTCETKGACCLDAHFVNVRITRLEAIAIRGAITELSPEKQVEILARIDNAIEKYGLSGKGDSFRKTYACPLFEQSAGCLVHAKGKPLPCITHACYERLEDLPPDELLTEHESKTAILNRLTYNEPVHLLPLPVAIKRYSPRDLKISAINAPDISQPTI
ncbi:MAG: hypothetical protein ACT4O9_00030 [Blastocatellia bacterium]